MSSILNVSASAEARITDETSGLFGEYVRSQAAEILEHSRSFLEPIRATNSTRITKWVVPHDSDNITTEVKKFTIFGQEIEVVFMKSHYYESYSNGTRRKVEVLLPKYSTEVTMQTYWQFNELGKVLEPYSVMHRTLSPEFLDLDNFVDDYGRPRVGSALACAFHGVGEAINHPNANTISSIARISHGLNVLDFHRKADFFKELYFDLKNNKLDAKKSNDESLPKLGVDSFSLSIPNEQPESPDSIIRGVSYRNQYTNDFKPKPLIDSEILGNEQSAISNTGTPLSNMPVKKFTTKK